MAKRKDYLVEGKYGLPASAEQVNTAINNLMFYLDYFDPRKAASFQNWRGSIGDDFLQNKDSNTKKEFAQTFKDKKTAEKHSEKLKEMQKTVRDIIQKKGPRHKRLWGYIELSEKMMDTEAGDFGAAMKDNAYLSLLCNM